MIRALLAAALLAAVTTAAVAGQDEAFVGAERWRLTLTRDGTTQDLGSYAGRGRCVAAALAVKERLELTQVDDRSPAAISCTQTERTWEA